jgi:hypothetical protein
LLRDRAGFRGCLFFAPAREFSSAAELRASYRVPMMRELLRLADAREFRSDPKVKENLRNVSGAGFFAPQVMGSAS